MLIVVLLLVVGVGLYLWQPWSTSSGSTASGDGSELGGTSASAPKSKPDATAQAFAAAWSTHAFDGVAYVGGVTSTHVASEYDTIVKELQAGAVKVSADPVTRVPGDDNADRSALHVTWTLPGGQTWTYDSAVELDDVDGAWLVKWAPSVVEPTLDTGDTLRYSKLAPKRASILDGADQPLIVDRPVVDIGIEPDKAGDPTATANQIAAIVHVDAASLAARIKAAPPTQFVDVITLR